MWQNLSIICEFRGGKSKLFASPPDTVLQSVNGDPTLFSKGTNSQGTTLSGSIKVKTGSDGDFVGFVLGYDAGELSRATADFWLVDWKQGNQNFRGRTALKGLSLSHISDNLSSVNSLDYHIRLVSLL